jgi:hypothetical protein
MQAVVDDALQPYSVSHEGHVMTVLELNIFRGFRMVLKRAKDPAVDFGRRK